MVADLKIVEVHVEGGGGWRGRRRRRGGEGEGGRVDREVGKGGIVMWMRARRSGRRWGRVTGMNF